MENQLNNNYNELITIIENLKKVVKEQNEKIKELNRKVEGIEETKKNSVNDSNNFEYIDSY